MTEVCVTWKQPDGDHFNGWCTNRFRLTTPPEGVAVVGGCELCVIPDKVVDECNPCENVPFTFETVSMSLTLRSWPAISIGDCTPYPTTQLRTIDEIVALPMNFVNRCFWESERLTIGKGCGSDRILGTPAWYYAVIQKTVRTDGGSPVIFQYHTWLSTSFDGDPVYMSGGTIPSYAIIGYRLIYTGPDPCYRDAMTLAHSGSDDVNGSGQDVTYGYITARDGGGSFGTVVVRGVAE